MSATTRSKKVQTERTVTDAVADLETAATDLANRLGPQPDDGPSAAGDVQRIDAVTNKLNALAV